MKCADLHFHTKNSDGKHSVEWVTIRLKEAVLQGLGLAVLTDHDGIGGYEAFAESVSTYWHPICASELSCTFFDDERKAFRELHLLMYGINPREPEIQKWFEKFKIERANRFFKICEKFREAGYQIDGDKIAAKHQGVLGRPHIADALVEAGIVKNRHEAFEKFLHDGHPFNVPKWRFPLEEAVAYAKKNGCKTSVAHPGQNKFSEKVIRKFKDVGVDAIEIYHPRHTQDDRNFYGGLARQLNLSMTGGSDFHTDETDCVAGSKIPSLGRTSYPLDLAEKFLGDFL